MSINETGEAAKPLNYLRFLAVMILVLFVLFITAMCWPDREMMSRDIGCAKVSSARGKEICNALSASMQWTWMGHAIISPGWRTTWPGVAKVYCSEHVTVADLPVLDSLKTGFPDWRLESGAEELTALTKNANGMGDEPENSIFNPKNPSYILKGGCR
jgi:hypothetical protein